MKRFLSVLVASMFIASAGYAQTGKSEEKKGTGKTQSESVKTEGKVQSDSVKAERAKEKSKSEDKGNTDGKTIHETKPATTSKAAK